MIHQIELCDLCEAPLDKHTKTGIGTQFIRSIGGWGHREDLIDWSGEVCPKCKAEFIAIKQAVQAWLKARGGIRAPIITVTSRDEVKITTDPPPERPTLAESSRNPGI